MSRFGEKNITDGRTESGTDRGDFIGPLFYYQRQGFKSEFDSQLHI